MYENKSELIHEIEKNKAEVIRFEIGEYKGTKIVNCRVYARTENGVVPTKKGIAFNVSLLKGVLEGFYLVSKKLNY